jgi:hypothetical protein
VGNQILRKWQGEFLDCEELLAARGEFKQALPERKLVGSNVPYPES